MIVVAKNISVLQLFISRMPKMCAIPQLVSAPLNPRPIAEHFRRSLLPVAGLLRDLTLGVSQDHEFPKSECLEV